jgi:hypothetical protein
MTSDRLGQPNVVELVVVTFRVAPVIPQTLRNGHIDWAGWMKERE